MSTEYYPAEDSLNLFAVRPAQLVPAAVALAVHLGEAPPDATPAASLAYLVDGLDRVGVIGARQWTYNTTEHGLRTCYYQHGGTDLEALKVVLGALAPHLDDSTELEYERIISPGVYEKGYLSVQNGALFCEEGY